MKIRRAILLLWLPILIVGAPRAVAQHADADSIELRPFDSTARLQLTHTTHEYDSLIALWEEEMAEFSIDHLHSDYLNLDTTKYVQAMGATTDTEFKERLMRIPSPIILPYNPSVRNYLVSYTTTHYRILSNMLSRAQYYFPIIEPELERAGVPLEMRFMAVIESALRADAIGRGSTGLWQFTVPTGRFYGLEINSLVDERMDPVASTRAAGRYMMHLYEVLGDWSLVIAAYNYGPSNVNKAIRRAGGTPQGYWDIYTYLPAVTRNYVPAFIALIYGYYYHEAHSIKAAPSSIPLSTDTVTISRYLHLEQVSSTLEIPLEVLQHLNPQYRQSIIPAYGRTYPLTLPQREVTRFLELEQQIYATDSLFLKAEYRYHNMDTAQVKQLLKSELKSHPVKTYTVRKGDNLGRIAINHSTTVAKLMRWNNLRNTNLQIGQKLKVSAP